MDVGCSAGGGSHEHAAGLDSVTFRGSYSLFACWEDHIFDLSCVLPPLPAGNSCEAAPTEQPVEAALHTGVLRVVLRWFYGIVSRPRAAKPGDVTPRIHRHGRRNISGRHVLRPAWSAAPSSRAARAADD